MADRLFLEFHTTGGHVLDLVPADELLEAAKQYVLKRLDLNTLNADDFVVTVDGKISRRNEDALLLGHWDVCVLCIERRDNITSP
jgi:hypothetical protein